MPTQREQPYSGFNFKVEIADIGELHFAEVSGLGAEIATIEYRSGSDRINSARKLPGLTSYPPVIFRRGVVGDTALWEWFDATSKGEDTRQVVSVLLLDEKGEEVVRWSLVNAWPSRWEGPSLRAADSAVAIELLELTHERLVLA